VFTESILTPALKTMTVESVKLLAGYLVKKISSSLGTKITPNTELLERKITSIKTVRTLFSNQNDTDLYSFYYPPQLSSASKTTPHNQNRTIIEGIVGQGKSIFMRHLAINLITTPNEFPIFIELRKISSGNSLKNLLISYLGEIGCSADEKTFDKILKSNTHLVLDGFDEIPADLIKETISYIENLNESKKNLKITISSRPNHDIQKCSGFRIVKINPITESDYENFMKKLNVISQ
jgi:predicted NACHT family NTPase